MATYAQNSTFFQANNNLHNCLLSLSAAGVVVERVQVRPNGTLVQINDAAPLAHDLATHLVLAESHHNGVAYRQTELCGCTVIWQANQQQVAA